MWLKDRLAQLTTPKVVKAFLQVKTERIVATSLQQSYWPHRRLSPSIRAKNGPRSGVLLLQQAISVEVSWDQIEKEKSYN